MYNLELAGYRFISFAYSNPLTRRILFRVGNEPGFDGGNGGGDTGGDTGGDFVWDELKEGKEIWNMSLPDLLVWAGERIYIFFIMLCLFLAGLKLVTAFGNYFSTSDNNAQLKVQYKNDIKEVVTGFLMLTLGAEALTLIMSAIFPGTEGIGVVNRIKSSISAPGNIFSDLGNKFKGLNNVKGGVKIVFYLTSGVLIIMFAIRTISNAVKYFKSEDERERLEAKNNIKNNLIGIFAIMLAATIINTIISAFFSAGSSVINY